MNTVRILICVTFALLIAALVHSYTNKGGEKSISELREELERVRLEKTIERERAEKNSIAYNQYSTGVPYTTPEIVADIPPIPSPENFVNPIAQNPIDQTDPPETDMSVNAKLLAENKKLKEKQALQEAENNMLHQEAGAIQKELQMRNQPEVDRAAEIAQALVMARVKVYDPKSGIIVLDLERAENLVTGQVLGIRRGTAGGIIGRIKLGKIESSDLGYADVIPQSFFGDKVNIEVGDEIIVIP